MQSRVPYTFCNTPLTMSSFVNKLISFCSGDSVGETASADEADKILANIVGDLDQSIVAECLSESVRERIAEHFGETTLDESWVVHEPEPLDGSWVDVETPVYDERRDLRDNLGLNDPVQLEKDKEEEKRVHLQKSFVAGHNIPVTPRPLSMHVEQTYEGDVKMRP